MQVLLGATRGCSLGQTRSKRCHLMPDGRHDTPTHTHKRKKKLKIEQVWRKTVSSLYLQRFIAVGVLTSAVLTSGASHCCIQGCRRIGNTPSFFISGRLEAAAARARHVALVVGAVDVPAVRPNIWYSTGQLLHDSTSNRRLPTVRDSRRGGGGGAGCRRGRSCWGTRPCRRPCRGRRCP